MSEAEIVACNCVLLTKVVVRGLAFQDTNEPDTKLLPVTVMVKSGPPAVTLVNDKPPSVGTGFPTFVVPDWLMATETPEIEMFAERSLALFAMIVNVLVAGPVPVAGPVTVIHDGRPEMTQTHDEDPWNTMVRLPPVAGNWNVDGLAE